jgi:hypothetical protein
MYSKFVLEFYFLTSVLFYTLFFKIIFYLQKYPFFFYKNIDIVYFLALLDIKKIYLKIELFIDVQLFFCFVECCMLTSKIISLCCLFIYIFSSFFSKFIEYYTIDNFFISCGIFLLCWYCIIIDLDSGIQGDETFMNKVIVWWFLFVGDVVLEFLKNKYMLCVYFLIFLLNVHNLTLRKLKFYLFLIRIFVKSKIKKGYHYCLDYVVSIVFSILLILYPLVVWSCYAYDAYHYYEYFMFYYDGTHIYWLTLWYSFVLLNSDYWYDILIFGLDAYNCTISTILICYSLLIKKLNLRIFLLKPTNEKGYKKYKYVKTIYIVYKKYYYVIIYLFISMLSLLSNYLVEECANVTIYGKNLCIQGSNNSFFFYDPFFFFHKSLFYMFFILFLFFCKDFVYIRKYASEFYYFCFLICSFSSNIYITNNIILFLIYFEILNYLLCVLIFFYLSYTHKNSNKLFFFFQYFMYTVISSFCILISFGISISILNITTFLDLLYFCNLQNYFVYTNKQFIILVIFFFFFVVFLLN